MKKLHIFILVLAFMLTSCSSSQDQEFISLWDSVESQSSNLQIDSVNKEEGKSLNSF